MIGPSVVGTLDVVGVVTSDVLAGLVGATVRLGVASAYGSIGRMSPEGPAASERIERIGNVAAGALELDAGSSVAEAVVSDCFARRGSTIQRPAAKPAAPPAASQRTVSSGLLSWDMTVPLWRSRRETRRREAKEKGVERGGEDRGLDSRERPEDRLGFSS